MLPKSWPSIPLPCSCGYFRRSLRIAAEKNSTLVLPFPVELLRFLYRSTSAAAGVPGRPLNGEGDPADGLSLLEGLAVATTPTTLQAELGAPNAVPRS
jgi:hypothetical protein